jgi:hypothetical protein
MKAGGIAPCAKEVEEQGQAVGERFIVFVRQSIPRLLDFVDVSYPELRQQR